MATIIVFGTSCASSACVLRGAPQKVIPYIFTKHITASPPVTASITIAGNDSNLLIVFYVQIMPDD
ncbi:hypothetical protein UL79_04540, partial [Shigella dysenteriae]